jgi:hypothetical protein
MYTHIFCHGHLSTFQNTQEWSKRGKAPDDVTACKTSPRPLVPSSFFSSIRSSPHAESVQSWYSRLCFRSRNNHLPVFFESVHTGFDIMAVTRKDIAFAMRCLAQSEVTQLMWTGWFECIMYFRSFFHCFLACLPPFFHSYKEFRRSMGSITPFRSEMWTPVTCRLVEPFSALQTAANLPQHHFLYSLSLPLLLYSFTTTTLLPQPIKPVIVVTIERQQNQRHSSQ